LIGPSYYLFFLLFSKIYVIKMETRSSVLNMIINYIKAEILKSDIRTEIIKPILVYLLYYIIPFVFIFLLLNFFVTIAAVFLVSYLTK
jgi:hypothetical protein